MLRTDYIKLLIFLIIIPASTLYSSEKITFNGHYKSFFVVINLADLKFRENDPEPDIVAVNNSWRMDLSGKFNDRLSFSFAYNFAPRVQGPSINASRALATNNDSSAYRAYDLERRLYPPKIDCRDDFAIFQNLDRLQFIFAASRFDIYTGRQAIAWGSARAINPTDILAPYRYEELDTEERIGVDALRIRIPLNLLSELDAGYVVGKDFKFANSAIFLRNKLYAFKSDISLVLIEFKKNLLIGMDLASSFKGAGIWLETAYVIPDLFTSDDSTSEDGYLRSSIGCDYSINGNTYAFIEYHYNQPGCSEPENYSDNFDKIAYTEGSVYLMGKHYLIPGINYQISPLISCSAQFLLNLTDPSALFAPQFGYNFAENFYFQTGFFKTIGKNAETDHGSSNIIFKSEFGGYPDIYYASFSIYF